MPAPPAVNHRILEALLQDWLPHAKGRRLVLVYGRYDDTVTEFTTSTDQTRRRVHVTDQHSVLGIVQAWQDHQATHPGEDDILVVTTSVDDAQLGWDIRGYALGQGTRTVDRGRIVAQRFGAVDIDPRIRRETWLLDALLDGEPPDGWPRNGSVLTRDTAVRALLGARLGGAALGEGPLDAGALLEWSRDPAGPARFAGLPRAEQDGLTAWLAGTVGDIAPLLMRLAAAGCATDAMPLGVVGAAVTRPDASPEAALAFGGLLGGVQSAALRVLTDAVEGTLARWVTEAESGSRHSHDARRQVLAVVARADELAASVQLTAALAGNRFLPSSFDARLRALAAAVGARPDPAAVARADTALDAVRDHCLARLDPHRYRAAEMAVRLLRWLAQPPASIESVAAGVRDQLADRAWVDWALTVLWAGEPSGDPVVGQLYRAVCEQVRARRDQLDEAFAQRLVVWSRHASVQDTGGCLLIEQVLATVAVPLAATRPPLVVVLDGMSGAVAVELGEQLAAQSWTEVSPAGRRAAAVAVIPSVTGTSRSSLLAGALTVGEQPVEKDRFAAFWRRHRREAAALFHKNDIGGTAGHRLADDLVTALARDGVVGVVLNTIDDALDHGKEGDRTGWSLRDITYLPELLDAARSYDRPVLLVSDHGHVLDRATEARPADPAEVESARWRTGTPEPGEVALAGPRVLHGGGTVVAAWREDIRYTYRKYGYHGGASLAEMTVPVLVLLPSAELTPAGWQVLAPEALTPPWWQRRRTAEPTTHPVISAPKPSRARKPQPPDAVPLFTVDQPDQPRETIGAQVVATEVYQRQRLFVRRAPDKHVVAAVIDALVEADNVLSLSAIVTVAGRAARSPFFAATLQRLLNVDGYPVLSVVDGERRLKLEPEVLRMQFGVRDT